MIERALLFLSRLARAWRYYRVGHFSWRLSWMKSSSEDSVLSR